MKRGGWANLNSQHAYFTVDVKFLETQVSIQSSKFFERLEFPSIWIDRDLYPRALRERQESLLSQEPEGVVAGAEHYRYGAFCYYVKSEHTTEEQLHLLIEAASQDPDMLMAQAALIDLVSHPRCTEALYRDALRVFRDFPRHGFDETRLERGFRQRIPSWRHG